MKKRILGITALTVLASSALLAPAASASSAGCGWFKATGPHYAVAEGGTTADYANAVTVFRRNCLEEPADLRTPEVKVRLEHKWATGQTDMAVAFKSISTDPMPGDTERTLVVDHPAIPVGDYWESPIFRLSSGVSYTAYIHTSYTNNLGPGGFRSYVGRSNPVYR
ncbi:hypothetical protein ACIBG8_49070 [Nonomuraea sp. NPDC050556]|uniref:hypothetical protein n=1 Tax=Nonomuraea sp. NPDC050556 TaxID=3364369 RepID=UPI0037917BBE